MTDKSFGDHTNRNTLKNPLLSTAVTGLSFEDLTHNAVLLPVSLSQEMITRSDQQIGTQSRTLGHTDHAASSLHAGDTNTNPSPLPTSSITLSNSPNLPQSLKTNPELENSRPTQSKASSKSNDDFDVNEYFARLQGTRYVSAPLNSVLKEDASTNLEATEENLEEINLNEPEKVFEQSLTSDIAQNFSQLPTMLPQVASAVFSSFSNMLQTRKSREPTPDSRNLGYQEVQFERPPDPVSEYVPPVAPPKEPLTMPPTVGTANYRLPTKKKYAQIPGLSSRDSAQIPLQPNLNLPPVSQGVPQYFVPADVGHGQFSQNEPLMSYNTPPMSQNAPPLSQNVPFMSQNAPPMSKSAQMSQNPPHVSKNAPSMSQNAPNASQIAPLLSQNVPSLSQNAPLVNQTAPPMNQNVPPMAQNIPQFSQNASQSVPSLSQAPPRSSQPMPPTSQNVPQYFIPEQDSVSKTITENQATQLPPNKSSSVHQESPFFVPTEVQHQPTKENEQPSFNIGGPNQQPSRFAKSEAISAQNNDDRTKRNDNLDANKAQSTPTYFIPTYSNEETPVSEEKRPMDLFAPKIPQDREDQVDLTAISNINLQSYGQNPNQILPPPPTFANFKKEYQPTGGQNILSPSVARRITSNHPVVKHTPQVMSFDNIFVPTPLTEASDVSQNLDVSFSVPATRHIPTNMPLQSSHNLTRLDTTQDTKLSTLPPKSDLPTVGKSGLPLPPSSGIKPPPSIFNPSSITPEVGTSDTSKYVPPPPLFMTVPGSSAEAIIPPKSDIAPSQFISPSSQSSNQPLGTPTSSQIFPPVASNLPPTSFAPPVETKEFPPKVDGPPKVPEPPKASGNVNFRMAKKRPQYYAGPIEGVGAISNQVKPIIPPVNTGSYQGALFTPQVESTPTALNPAAALTENTPTIETTSTPFDINRSAPDSYSAPFDISRPVESAPYDHSRQETYPAYQTPQDSIYNTAFDMSRQTTERYEPTQDSSSFGLFGSLKSKLSSLDINKIQSTVTTFFDPAYNDTKKEEISAQQNAPYQQQQYTPYGQAQASNFEIFVPNVEQATEAYNQPYNYQPPYQSHYNYGQGNQYYQSQDTYNYYQNTSQNVGSYFGDEGQSLPATNTNVQETYPGVSVSQEQAKNPFNIVKSQSGSDRPSLDKKEEELINPQSSIQVTHSKTEENVPEHTIGVPSQAGQNKVTNQQIGTNLFQPQTDSTYSFFDNQPTRETRDKTKTVEKEPEIVLKDEYQNSLRLDESQMKTQEVFSNPADSEKVNQEFTFKASNSAVKSFFDNPGMPTEIENKISHVSPICSNLKPKHTDMNFDNVPNFFNTIRTHIPTQDVKENIDLNTSEIVKDVISSVIEAKIDQIDRLESDSDNVVFPQSNPLDFFSSFAKESSAQSVFSDFGREEMKVMQTSQKIGTKEDDYIRDVSESFMSSAPLFGLSTMLADKTKELNDLEDEIRRMSLQEPSEDIDLFKKSANVSFIENLDATDENTEAKPEVSDLNICETCREVNKPDDRDEMDDLTTQLIENITSPIQLLNAVEVPLPEHITPSDERTDFDSNQCAEISHITEETIETIQVQSATELLEDEQDTRSNVRGYGWTEESFPDSDERNYSVPFQTKLEQDFNLPINPNTIGFLGGERGLFEKMAVNKDLEPDLKFESPIVLSRQMSVPSAPPHEDDQKSEGIDVHSIEQDAKKDFPIFEEFVIEPDKDFKQSSESLEIESFTSRVDKYKEKEGTEPSEKTSPIFDLNATTSPSLPIASYFDTGNYAAETHYRNSLASPNQVRVPPGFEDEFQKLLTQDSGDRKDIIPTYIPDTSTQTRPIDSPTFSTAQNVSYTKTVTSSNMTVPKTAGELPLPDFGSIFKKDLHTDAKPGCDEPQPLIAQSLEDVHPDFELLTSQRKKDTAEAAVKDKLPDFDSIFGAKHEEKILEIPFDKPASTPQVPAKITLPDPINFFSSNVESVENTSNQDQGFNRLASYFSSPAKTDQGKSFFELSQSQNHYRRELEAADTKSANKTDFPTPQTQNLPTNIQNIPSDQYLANLNLMNDLTSYQNAEFKPETVMRHVNYFTVEYDNETLVNEFNKGEPGSKRENLAAAKFPKDYESFANDKSFNTVIKKCTHCCNFDVGPVKKCSNINHECLTDFKVKKCMDGNDKDTKKECSNMDTPKEVDARQSITVNFNGSPHEDNEGVASTISENRSVGEYTPVRHHWFYRIDIEGKSTWRGFSVVDSRSLEEAFNSPELDDDTRVPTDGGRFDVNINGRLRYPVYWNEKPSNVRRCSWFYKGNTEIRYVPYTEEVAEKLEEEYRHGMVTGEWHRRLVLPNNEVVVMHQPHVMVHFLQGAANDAFSAPPQSTMRPRVVRRGCDESEIEEVEPSSIDHLLLMCHGVGSACDMKFRSVEEVVDDFRATSLQLIQSHYRNSYDSGAVGRVEVLPVSWHATLHSGETGVDRRLARITLDSIPRLRNFTNDTVLDVLFYTSPVFCQTIINTVCSELNRIYKLFCSRNPDFQGGVSLGGHSLGSVILYDLLCHQTPSPPSPSSPAAVPPGSEKQYVRGAGCGGGAGQPAVRYPPLHFAPTALYALGSPIAIFECIRGVDALGPQFSLPTCKNFFNIFHPYDPIAYRIEPLINPQLRDVKPSLIPHHKGRKRMHLELKDTMARVGADIKQKLVESIRSTWSNMWKTQLPTDKQLEKVVEEEMEKEQLTDECKEELKNDETSPDMLGALNGGRRVDYVLQEAPFEMINEYLFAMSSHVCYWESEDTMLLMLREIYDSLGVQPDCTVPQNSLTVNRVRTARTEEKYSLIANSTDHPSTSRGST